MRENAIEWLNGDDTVTVTLSQTKYINKVKALAAKTDEVKIAYENEDGSILADLPLKYIKISQPRKISDNQREAARERLLKSRGN